MSGDLGNQIGASGKDALGAITTLAMNPVGGLAPAYEGLGEKRALGAGLMLCVAFAILTTIGVGPGASRLFGMFGGFGMDSNPGFTFYLRSFLQLLVVPAVIIGVSLGIRKVLGGKKPIAADVFTTGAALTPLGLASFLTGLLGSNLNVATVFILFGWSYLILMLYAGLTRVGGVTERAAAPAVPVLLILSGWVWRVIFGAM